MNTGERTRLLNAEQTLKLFLLDLPFKQTSPHLQSNNRKEPVMESLQVTQFSKCSHLQQLISINRTIKNIKESPHSYCFLRSLTLFDELVFRHRGYGIRALTGISGLPPSPLPGAFLPPCSSVGLRLLTSPWLDGSLCSGRGSALILSQGRGNFMSRRRAVLPFGVCFPFGAAGQLEQSC